jgi:hypothetical protein
MTTVAFQGQGGGLPAVESRLGFSGVSASRVRTACLSEMLYGAHVRS